MSGTQSVGAQQEAYLARFRSEMQAQMMQEVMNKMTESCFKVCTGKRGNGLDSSEMTCLTNCVGRYMETMNTVNQTMQLPRQSK